MVHWVLLLIAKDLKWPKSSLTEEWLNYGMSSQCTTMLLYTRLKKIFIKLYGMFFNKYYSIKYCKMCSITIDGKKEGRIYVFAGICIKCFWEETQGIYYISYF